MTQPRLVIGVTGPIACGKSSVMAALADHGAVRIDADLVYRDLVGPGLPLTKSLAERFGPGILTDNGELNRKALGAIVFNDPANEVSGTFSGSGTLAVGGAWFDTASTHSFGGERFYTIGEADLVVQDGLPTPGVAGLGFDHVLTHELGHTLGLLH